MYQEAWYRTAGYFASGAPISTNESVNVDKTVKGFHSCETCWTACKHRRISCIGRPNTGRLCKSRRVTSDRWSAKMLTCTTVDFRIFIQVPESTRFPLYWGSRYSLPTISKLDTEEVHNVDANGVWKDSSLNSRRDIQSSILVGEILIARQPQHSSTRIQEIEPYFPPRMWVFWSHSSQLGCTSLPLAFVCIGAPDTKHKSPCFKAWLVSWYTMALPQPTFLYWVSQCISYHTRKEIVLYASAARKIDVNATSWLPASSHLKILILFVVLAASFHITFTSAYARNWRHNSSFHSFTVFWVAQIARANIPTNSLSLSLRDLGFCPSARCYFNQQYSQQNTNQLISLHLYPVPYAVCCWDTTYLRKYHTLAEIPPDNELDVGNPDTELGERPVTLILVLYWISQYANFVYIQDRWGKGLQHRRMPWEWMSMGFWPPRVPMSERTVSNSTEKFPAMITLSNQSNYHLLWPTHSGSDSISSQERTTTCGEINPAFRVADKGNTYLKIWALAAGTGDKVTSRFDKHNGIEVQFRYLREMILFITGSIMRKVSKTCIHYM